MRKFVIIEVWGLLIDDCVEDDVHAIDFANDFATKLVSLFSAVCDQPFSVELLEFKCGEDEPYVFVSIDSILMIA